MTDSGKAVFLSYASQDAEAAKRICDALRQAGVEVWFDQSELVGGDQWDTKIRGQIGSCALFMPIISANTQARLEGYFRIEWKLAARRTHAMASAKAFLLPVVIDETRDAAAHVPDEFREVQWTRLKAGETPPAFAARVKRLLSGEQGAGSKEEETVGAALRRDGSEGSGRKAPPSESRRASKWWWALPIFGVTMALMLVIKEQRKDSLPAAPAPSAVALSEARALVAKAWDLMNKPEMARAELDAADNCCRQAAALDPNDAEVSAAWSQVDSWYVYHGLERTQARQEGARTKAARALSQAPHSYEARLAQACYLVREGGGQSAVYDLDGANGLLLALLREKPDEPRALLAQGILFRNTRNIAGYRDAFSRAAKSPGFAVQAYNELGWAEFFTGNSREAEAAADASIKLHPYWANLNLKTNLLAYWWGDLERARTTLDQISGPNRQEDYAVSTLLKLDHFRRDPDGMLRVINRLSRDWLESNAYDGPVAWWNGLAQQMAGHAEAAQLQWQIALKLVQERLAGQPDSSGLLRWKARLLLASGDRAGGETAMRLAREMGSREYFSFEALDEILLGNKEAAIAALEQRAKVHELYLAAAYLRLSPEFDRLRDLPRFQALLARMEADPRFSPKAVPAPSPLTALSLSNGLPARPEPAERAPAPPPEADAKSVAVLAFANLSDDKANEYFSDGISEELLNVLAKISGLKVAARTSAFYFKGKEVPVPEIAKQLGVAYVVEGSVRKQGDKVRITAQLIKAADGFHVWSDTFTRDLKDIFAVQDEIAGLIAKNLELKMGIVEVAARQAVSPEAYQEYLLGRAAAAKAGTADLREAVTHFYRAVALEPHYTAAWVQLASAHTRLGRWGGAPTRQAWAAARAAIDRARALEPDSPEVLLALGWILRTGEWNWREAERAFRRALTLQPNQPEILAGTAVLLYNIGQTEEAFRLARQAIQLDPLNAGTQIDLSLMFHMNKNWAEAEQSARRALQLAPGGTSYHCLLGWGLIAQQRYPEAEAEINLDKSEDGVDRSLSLGLLAIARGEDKVARDWLARLEEIARTNGDLADLQQNIAWLNTSLGDKDRAFAALEKAYTSRDPSMSWLLNSWWLEPLYSDPRWPALVRKVGLSDEQLK